MFCETADRAANTVRFDDVIGFPELLMTALGPHTEPPLLGIAWGKPTSGSG